MRFRSAVVALAAIALIIAGIPVVVDALTSPRTWVDSPAEDSTVTGDLVVTGSARHPDGVKVIELVVKNRDTNRYWNGQTWQRRFIRFDVPVDDHGGRETGWSFTLSGEELVEGSYRARAFARSVEGNGDSYGGDINDFRYKPGLDPSLYFTEILAPVTGNGDQFGEGRTALTVSEESSPAIPTAAAPSPNSQPPDGEPPVLPTPVPPTTEVTPSSTTVGPATTALATTAPATTSATTVPVATGVSSTARSGGSGSVVWVDDFDVFDGSRWVVEHSTYGDGNGEMQCYRPENVSVSGGRLVLRAVSETYTCPNGSTRLVTSGMVRSRGVLFGPGQVIEFRVKLSPGDEANQGGLWPAVWSSGWAGGGWPAGGELDFLEVMTANDARRSVFSVHYAKPGGSHGVTNREVMGSDNFSVGWHTVRFEYGRGGVLGWYLDGALVHTVTSLDTLQGYPAPFDQATNQIKINLAVGGRPGPLDPRALGPNGATFEIDYIKVTSL